jgi:hypothetical protein
VKAGGGVFLKMGERVEKNVLKCIFSENGRKFKEVFSQNQRNFV